MARLIEHSKDDPTIEKLKQCVKLGHRIPMTADLKGYRQIAAELSISQDGLLMKGDTVVLPESLWQTVINCAHKGHMGSKLCVRLIKEHYFFPNIQKLVSASIDLCDANSDTTKLNPILSNMMPREKWKLIAIDFSSRTPTGDYVLVIMWLQM